MKVGDVKILIPNLSSKTNYVLHYRNLQLYLPLGMKLLMFKQYDGMRKYIDFNTKKKTNVANSFEKDYLKLIINSFYVRLVNNEKDF